MAEKMLSAPAPEFLEHLVKVFNTSEMLRHFDAVIEFPDDERVRATVPEVKPYMHGGLQGAAVNGGIINALLDLVIGMTGLVRGREARSATVQMSVSFLRPLTGTKVVAEGWIEKGGATLLFSAGHVLDAEGNVCATATGVVRLIAGKGAIGGVTL